MRLTLPSGQRVRRLWRLAAPIVVALLVFAVWATNFNKWSWESFKRPIGYVLDGMFTLSLVKAGSETAFVPFLSKEVPNLGAPFIANWNDFPMSDDHVYFFWGQVARVTGVIAALNVAYLACAVGAALTLFFVARWLRLRSGASVVAGVLYGVSPFLFYRSVHHFTLVNYWHVPLMVPLLWWSVRVRPFAFRSGVFAKAAAVAVLAGVHNFYYLNYCLQLLGLTLLGHVFARRWKRAGMSAVLIGIGFATFLACNFDTILSQRRLGPNPAAMHRSQADVEIYALRPFELFVPGPRHRIDAFAAAAERHRAAALAVGEFPSMYLGVVGGAAFIWLMVITLRSMLLAKRVGWARFGLFSAWLIFVAMDGGAMQMLQAISGQVLFRSNNRVSIVLLMFALLFLARLLTRASTTMGLAFVPLCIVLIACGVADQTPTNRIDPNVPHWETVVQREKVAEADEKLVAAVEQRLPVGAAIYQLPPIQFPEAGFYGRLPDYDQFRPYLFSKTLRFSYGNMKGRPEANWQNEVAAMSETQRLAELSRRGFGAIYVLKNAYAPQQIEQFLNSMRAQGHSEVLESEYGDSLFVLLNRGAAGR